MAVASANAAAATRVARIIIHWFFTTGDVSAFMNFF